MTVLPPTNDSGTAYDYQCYHQRLLPAYEYLCLRLRVAQEYRKGRQLSVLLPSPGPTPGPTTGATSGPTPSPTTGLLLSPMMAMYGT